eukprot:jgi/Chrzof1/7486/Cz02g25210.t1
MSACNACLGPCGLLLNTTTDSCPPHELSQLSNAWRTGVQCHISVDTSIAPKDTPADCCVLVNNALYDDVPDQQVHHTPEQPCHAVVGVGIADQEDHEDGNDDYPGSLLFELEIAALWMLVQLFQDKIMAAAFAVERSQSDVLGMCQGADCSLLSKQHLLQGVHRVHQGAWQA